ncbi:MAG TPA: aminotransferase class IV [Flavobacteriaceae bacterium]|nr:aminotransferase class IV [Flavobacteriaceae bacterium]
MINLNGKIFPAGEAKLSIENRGYQYGDALFETIRAIHGKIVFWEDHYFRLMASMRILRMEIPMEFSPEFLENEILNLIEANELKDKPVKIKLNVHRNPGGLYKPETRKIGYMIRVWELDSPFYILNNEPYQVELFKDYFVNSGLLSTLKTNNKILHVLGSIFAQENGFSNCILLNEKKMVTEALNGNLFLVQGKKIKTPPLSEGCLNGIIRKKLLEILQKLPEYIVEEKVISPFELQKADELFLTNVVLGIQPITVYRKKNFEKKIAGGLLAKINAVARLNQL